MSRDAPIVPGCRRSVTTALAALFKVLSVVLCFSLIWALTWAPAAEADVASREKWHPLAAAHLYAEFASALEPIDWDGITERYATVPPQFPHAGTEPAYAVLERLAGFAGRDPGLAIRAAIRARDVVRLRDAIARASSIAVRERLDRARRKHDRPRAALGDALLAQSIYRAFGEILRRADPRAYRRFGLAWLELTTALSAGSGRAGTAIDRLAIGLREAFESGNPPVMPRGTVWLPPDGALVEQAPLPRLVLNFEERGIDEKRLFLVAYGDMVFDSPLIFGGKARALGLSCSGCHNRGDINNALYIPGLSRHRGGIDVDGAFFNPKANDRRFDPLDTPSLRGIRFTAPYGRDGRIAGLREFARAVIVGEFAGPEPSPFMLDALVAYMNEFDFLPAPLLYRDGRLNAKASVAAMRGEAIFNRPYPLMAGRSCAGCHIPDGNFVDARRHDIGSAEPSSTHACDGAFDTPTLLGIKYSAPYFHDGSLPDLAAVVEWFNQRYAMGLDTAGAADLVAYLDAVGTGEEPFEKFDATNTRFKMSFDEASTFLSTLDTLIPARERPATLLLLETVVADIRTDVAGMTNTGARGRVDELADRIEAMTGAVRARDWQQAARLWADYKAAEARHAAEIY